MRKIIRTQRHEFRLERLSTAIKILNKNKYISPMHITVKSETTGNNDWLLSSRKRKSHTKEQ